MATLKGIDTSACFISIWDEVVIAVGLETLEEGSDAAKAIAKKLKKGSKYPIS